MGLKIKNIKFFQKATIERLILRNMRVTPIMIFVAVLFFGAKIIDLLTLQELREGRESGLVASEVAQTTAEMNNASKNNASDRSKKEDSIPSTKLENVNVDTMTPQKYHLLKEMEKGRTLKASGDEERIAKKEALEAVEVRVDKKIDALTKAEKIAKEQMDAEAKKKEEDRSIKLKRLIKIAEGFDPKEAALILQGVDFPILVELMSHIKESKASAILSKMETQKASYLLSAMGRQLEGGEQSTKNNHQGNATPEVVPPKAPAIVPAAVTDAQPEKSEKNNIQDNSIEEKKGSKESSKSNADDEKQFEEEFKKEVDKSSKKKTSSIKNLSSSEESKEDKSSDAGNQNNEGSKKSVKDKKKKEKVGENS